MGQGKRSANDYHAWHARMIEGKEVDENTEVKRVFSLTCCQSPGAVISTGRCRSTPGRRVVRCDCPS